MFSKSSKNPNKKKERKITQQTVGYIFLDHVNHSGPWISGSQSVIQEPPWQPVSGTC